MTRSKSIENDMSNTLCPECAAFDIRALLVAHLEASEEFESPLESYLLKPNLAALQESTLSCQLCSTIYSQCLGLLGKTALTDADLAEDLSTAPIFLRFNGTDPGRIIIPQLCVTQSYDGDGVRYESHRHLAYFDVCSAPDMEPQEERMHEYLGRVQSSNPSDAASIALAKTWLKECSDNHPRCNRSSSSQLPTRVLNVAALPNKVRLVYGMQHEGRYAALSYCWGGETHMCLDKNTASSLAEGVYDSALAPTIRHAVYMTRGLGIGYLWVDALCIRQDSKEDWAAEAARMSAVYRRAAITLEVASSSKPSEGFLNQRASSRPYVQLEWRTDSDQLEAVQLRPHYDVDDSQLTKTAIFSRGWTLQERILAPRTLSFGRQQMSFECVSGYQDEARKYALLPKPTEHHLSKKSMNQVRLGQNILHATVSWVWRLLGLPPWIKTPLGSLGFQGVVHLGPEDVTFYVYWRRLVEKFTERYLTNQMDRLAALSGLAKEIQSANNDTYCAGHWRGELLYSLGWECDNVYRAVDLPTQSQDVISLVESDDSDWPYNIRSSEYIAPSWSWASVRTSVEFSPRVQYTPLSTITAVKTIPRSSDPHGCLQGGYIDIKGPTLHIPDVLRACNHDYPYATLHAEVHRVVAHSATRAPEFWQHHHGPQFSPHTDQQFALLKLFFCPGKGESSLLPDMLYFLLVETCGDGMWRRLCIIKQAMNGFWSTIESLSRSRKAPWVKEMADSGGILESIPSELRNAYGPEIEYAARRERIAAEIRKASWKIEKIRIV